MGSSFSINLLDNIGEIKDKELCLRLIKKINPKYSSFSDMKLAGKINEEHNRNYKYFDGNYNELNSDIGARFLWVDSGLTDLFNDIIYFQFSKGAVEWKGALVNTEKGILKKQSEADGKEHKITELSAQTGTHTVSTTSPSFVPIIKTTDDETKITEFYTELYNRLLIQKDWNTDTLRNYVETLITRINYLLADEVDCSDILIYNDVKDAVIINTGLLDKFAHSINLMVVLHTETSLSFTKLFLVDSKVMLSKRGFSKDALKEGVERVSFFNEDISELLFDADIDDFDLENWNRLTHCIQERRSRFPDEYADKSDEALCQDMINAIEIGLKLNQYDSHYIKPIYHRKLNKLSWVIPYHVGNNFKKTAELGIVVARYDDNPEYWQVFTILDYDTVKLDLRILSLYSEEGF